MAESLKIKGVPSAVDYSPTGLYEDVTGAPVAECSDSNQLQQRSEEPEDDGSKLKLVDAPVPEDLSHYQYESNASSFLPDSAAQLEMALEVEVMSMEKALKQVLKAMNIEGAVWCLGEENNYYQVIFSMDSGDLCEEILRQLSECGIGSKMNSIVSVTPCSLHYQGLGFDIEAANSDPEEHTKGQDERKGPSKGSEWDKFLASVGARLTVAQVVQGVRSDANLTFDFLALLLISAFLSALGLVENSTGILVASMLISPLMGPVLAGTFGTVVRDKDLQKLGVRNELLGLLICLLVGCAFGFTIGLTVKHYGKGDWPTEEMLSRGEVHSVWVGILVALTSGAAVAIATLGDYTGSLVGVAISASLLPPAVNAGLLWSLACTEMINELQFQNNEDILEKANNYVYIDYPPADYAILGAISVCLTLINIICIFLAGILVLKIKEVAPHSSKEQQHFWNHDVKIVRDYNLTLDREDAGDLRRRLANELSGLSCDELQGGFKSGINGDFRSRNVRRFARYHVQELFNPSRMNQLTWSPSTRAFLSEDRPTAQDLDFLYKNFASVKQQFSIGSQLRKMSVGSQWPQGSQSSSSSRNSPWLKNVSPPVEIATADDDATTACLPTIPELHTSQLRPSSPSNSIPRSVQGTSGGLRFIVTPAEDPFTEV